MRIAIVHDWLVVYAGAERVLEQMLACYPDADLFSLVDFLPLGQRDFIYNKPATTSFIQRLPRARKKYRGYLPLMPLAIEQLDLSAYDLVLSSSHAVAKGVLTGPDQLHISYVHSPIRYAWDLQHQYLREAGLQRGIRSWMAKAILHYIRLWDVRTANGVDAFVANSSFIARRIRKVYRRESRVIYPPVDVADFPLCWDKEDFYVTASRMVPYKKVDLIVEAFSAMPDKRLVVIGDGPDFAKVRAKAGPNVQLLGFAGVEVLRDHLQRARAFVFAAEEDFGISPLEAQACGTPVIALGRGGALETIVPLLDAERAGSSPAPTGVFFYEQSAAAIIAAVKRFEAAGAAITPEACRENALRFAPERFRAEFTAFVEREWAAFQSGKQGGCSA
ncbi:glycosyltransferase family 4 protein [Acidithiobacillus caldus]|uniref:Glycosyl transferase, group 1 n=2 Tax=Acidithiobacillus caldus TaxID=33059 RepID=A0A059ZM40_ACICK|nr:glycosyltransferase family 4 protein [Acidithiobacillus caldus]AIA54129.1 glycosyl transferase, group 1 [Acidithiobacillus caldus ATCC 51756]MBU2729055.1 glycosyltransferase family 4 protein [Acidithiobacillus caldus]MBU2736839.1 glycosyltransferase family 4 protein [Acidithiobacillus caldus ATCC 51756]MBU2746300.1 glycosyltransferase family 4 protein [Acidithiobacillus caldus]MBU2779778.1 glycosyltransferase family 4 protein [Acidithiobacillus caldus]